MINKYYNEALRLKTRLETLYSDYKNFNARYESQRKKDGNEMPFIEKWIFSNIEQGLENLIEPMEYMTEGIVDGCPEE